MRTPGNAEEARHAQFSAGSFIAGEWRLDGAWHADENPSDHRDVVGDYAWADAGAVADALAAARGAQKAWSRSNPQIRADILRGIGDRLLAAADILGTLVAREEGKTLAEGRGEAIRAAQVFHYFAGEPLRHPGGFFASLRDGFNIIVDHEPIGVVALITPWNFPLATPAWKIAAALAYGNCVIFKPSEYTPASAVALTEILIEAGVPTGVFNMLLGDGALLGPLLIDGADGVSFTGSTGSGQRVLERAARTMAKVQLELGGKNPLVILDDAALDDAVDVALQGAFHQTGQRCTASSRLIVTSRIHDAFVERLADRVDRLRVGNALDPDTEMGPVANRPQFEKDLAAIQAAERDGARCVTRSDAAVPEGGYYMRPVLFADTSSAMPLNREEIFGPIAAVIRVADLDEAIAVANDTEFGLSSAICTVNLSAAEAFRRQSKAGMVMVNAPTAGVEYHVPFGGRAPSSYGGREQGTAAAEFFTEIKTSYINHKCR